MPKIGTLRVRRRKSIPPAYHTPKNRPPGVRTPNSKSLTEALLRSHSETRKKCGKLWCIATWGCPIAPAIPDFNYETHDAPAYIQVQQFRKRHFGNRWALPFFRHISTVHAHKLSFQSLWSKLWCRGNYIQRPRFPKREQQFGDHTTFSTVLFFTVETEDLPYPWPNDLEHVLQVVLAVNTSTWARAKSIARIDVGWT